MDNSLQPIEVFVQQGLAQRFQQVFGFPLTYTNTTDKKATAQRQLQKGVSYPFAFATVNSDTLTKTTYRPHSLWRRGLVAIPSADGMTAARLNLIPVTVEYAIEIKTQSFTGLRKIGKRWLQAYVQSALKYSITYGVSDLDINVVMSDNFQYPIGEGGVSEVKDQVATTTLTVEGYMSPDTLGKAQVINRVQGTGYAGNPHEIELLSTNDRARHRIFYFDTADTPAPPPPPPPPPPPSSPTDELSIGSVDAYPTASGLVVDSLLPYPTTSGLVVDSLLPYTVVSGFSIFSQPQL